MRWYSTSYLENRLFDSRLVKDSLLDNYKCDGDHHPERRDYRQFLENYPWSSIGQGQPPCIEKLSAPVVPPQVGNSLITTKPHPWRPTLGYEMLPAADQTISSLYMSPCYPTAGASEPVRFPNLVTGFERNPQHTARAALYTRFTPGEWINNCITRYTESDINRNQSERLRNEAVRVMRETDEKTSQGQRDAGRRLGERLTDVTFWRNELNAELEKLISETAMLSDTKRAVAKALQDCEAPLHIGQECLYHRENRQGVEKVHDHVEKSLLLEVDNLRNCQEKLRQLYEKVNKQLSDNRAAQHALEEDVGLKESTIGIDSVCHKLNNYSRGINYYGGIEKYDPTVSSMESWAAFSSNRINRSQTERGKSVQLRSDADTLINACATAIWDRWSNTNNSLDRRSSEMAEAKNKIHLHLHKVNQEIFDLERHIDLLNKAIQDKSNPLRVAQTRLEARTHREAVELCKDYPQMRLVQEVLDIQDSVSALHRKLQNAEAQNQQLLRTKSNLEADLKRKVNALFLDREKCMGLRRSFPVNNMIKY